MRMKAALEGNLEEYLDKELEKAETAVTRGISSATTQLKETMRSQVKAAKLGSRLAYTWPSSSLKTAGVVYSKAEKIMESFEYALVIRGKDGFWLAIPTPAIPKRIGNKKITPELYERRKGVRLRFVYRDNGTSLLVHEQKRKTIIAFWLVKQAKMPKLINFTTESQKMESLLPSFILANWKD